MKTLRELSSWMVGTTRAHRARAQWGLVTCPLPDIFGTGTGGCRYRRFRTSEKLAAEMKHQLLEVISRVVLLTSPYLQK
jgi:hypothetical protein